MTTGRRSRVFLILWATVVSAILIAPTLVVIPLGFTSGRTFKLPPDGWSTRWYREFFTSPQWREATMNSVVIAVLTAIIATVLGTTLALALNRGTGWWRIPTRGLAMAPLVLPPTIIAIGMFAVFVKWRLDGTVMGFVAAHSIVALPFVVTTVLVSLRDVDSQLERAAASLGAKPLTVFRKVLLPAIAPGVITGALFATIISFDEAAISIFLSTPDLRTLPTLIFRSVTDEVDPTIASVATLLLVVSSTLLLASTLFQKNTSGTRGTQKHDN